MKDFFIKLKHWLKKNYKKIIVFILILILLIFWWQKKETNQEVWETIYPQEEDLLTSLTVSGKIDATSRVRLFFSAGGKLTYLGAKEGDVVKKWQRIATIDQAALNKQMQQNLNLYMKERYQFEDVKDDNKDKILDTKETRAFAQKQFDLDNSVLNVELQQIAINNTALNAPFAGIMTVVPKTVAGVAISPTEFFEITDPNTLVFRATVDEVDISQLRKGLEATIVLDAYEDEEIKTQISFISYVSAESTTGTVFLVEFPFNSNDLNKYRLGMNGDVTIKLAEKKSVLTLPLEAIIERDDKKFVYLKNQETGEKVEQEITTGLENDEKVEVTSGLNPNQEIILPD